MIAEQSCSISSPDLSQIKIVVLKPENRVSGYQEAVTLARNQAAQFFEDYMLVSWYDMDRDFESPPNTTECPKACQKNGYIFYGLSHGAKLKVDIENGRFVFFFAPVE
jgi:hypothetical protein